MPGPAPSEPDQETVKLVEVVVAGSAVTVLVGGVASMVLVICGVAIGALVSKTMLAWALSVAPVARPGLGLDRVVDVALAVGRIGVGREEADERVRRACRALCGSSDVNVTVSRPVLRFRLASMST